MAMGEDGAKLMFKFLFNESKLLPIKLGQKSGIGKRLSGCVLGLSPSLKNNLPISVIYVLTNYVI